MTVLYSFVVRVSAPLLSIASLFSSRVKAWLQGRNNWKEDLFKAQTNENSFNVWFHCSSLGEFEQGRPLMEKLKVLYPSINLYITFFSPSGYTVRKEYPLAHYTGYLPLDTPANAQELIQLINPKLVVFVKAEIWPNFISVVKRKNIPSLLISARFYEDQTLFKRRGKLFLKALLKFDFIFVQDKLSQKLLKKQGRESILAGDTRYDNVLTTKNNPKTFTEIETFINGKNTLVVGSCWEQDLQVLLPYLHSNTKAKYILASHDVSEKMIKYIEERLKVPYVRYSTIFTVNKSQLLDAQVLIIDTIGILAQLYKYAYVAYIGGAFQQGLHNILEPAAFGVPVVFGPNSEGFLEAQEMLESAGVFSIKNEEALKNQLDQLFNDPLQHRLAGERNSRFIESKTGATEKIMTTLRTLLDNRINS